MKRNVKWILVAVMALLVVATVASVALADPKPPGIDPEPSPTTSDTM